MSLNDKVDDVLEYLWNFFVYRVCRCLVLGVFAFEGFVIGWILSYLVSSLVHLASILVHPAVFLEVDWTGPNWVLVNLPEMMAVICVVIGIFRLR